MPTGCERPISATAMPTKPAPPTIFQQQAVLRAQDFIDRHQAGKAAGNGHGDHDDALRLDAGIDGGLGVGADGADFIAELGAPEQIPDAPGRNEGEEHRRD